MNWFFSSASEPATNTVHTANNNNNNNNSNDHHRHTHQISEDERHKELQLLNELTPQLRQFYALESRSHHPFEETVSEEQKAEFQVFRKDPANSEKELSQMNCSEYQLRYLRCLTADKTSQLIKCSEDSKTVEKCLAFQKQMFYKLGLRYTKNIEKFNKITDTADELGVKWMNRVKNSEHGLDEVVLKSVYDARDYIWSKD